LSVKSSVGEVAVGEVIVGEVIVGEVIHTLIKYQRKIIVINARNFAANK
jgi:hypothetical protein